MSSIKDNFSVMNMCRHIKILDLCMFNNFNKGLILGDCV